MPTQSTAILSKRTGMTADERSKILAWVKGDCQDGVTAAGRLLVVSAIPNGDIGKPDLKVTMRMPNKIQAQGFLPYKYVILPLRI